MVRACRKVVVPAGSRKLQTPCQGHCQLSGAPQIYLPLWGSVAVSILVANSLDCVARPGQEYVLVLAAISMAQLRGEDGRSETGIRAVAAFATNIKNAPEPTLGLLSSQKGRFRRAGTVNVVDTASSLPTQWSTNSPNCLKLTTLLASLG